MRINSDTFNSILVGRKLMPDGLGPHVDQTHITPLAGRDKYLVLRGKHQTAGALIVAGKRHHQGLTLR